MSVVLHSLQSWLPLSEQFVHTLVTRSRHRAVVVCREPKRNLATFPHRPVYSLGWLPQKRLGTVAERRIISASLIGIAMRHRALLVHHHHGYRLADAAGVVKRRRVPFVVSLHGHDVAAFGREWPEYLPPTLALADAVISPSRYFVDHIVELGVPAERVVVVPSGVDVDWFDPTPLPDGPPEALFVGRFVEKKGIDVLLKAWQEVAARVPGARLRLLGHGPLEELARSGGPGVVVELTDASRRATQVRDALRRASLVVTPSRTAADGDVETLLLVNLEAQASARPVVTTRHGGIPEYVDDGRTALLVPENDAPALAEAMAKVLLDEELARRLAAAGPEWARRFDVRRCVEEIDALYDRLIR